MREICTEIDIRASAERVWQVLTDFTAYPHWNPVMQPISGEAKAGALLKVRVQLRRGLRVTLRTTVLKAEASRELRWQGQLLFAGFFRGEHSFTIEPMADGRVRFVQRETYSGWFAPVFLLLMRAANRRIFEDMNRALKARAEEAPLP
jgi:hypothetical protein